MIEVQNKLLNGYTFIDLFAGIGGFRLALESFGAECVFSSEWDDHAASVYEMNFGEWPHGDITKIEENSIPDHDILCAGFPCQAFSISGKQLGFEDSRGTLFFDVARIVKAKRPKVVLLENVKNFASHDGGKTLKVVKATLEELGYVFDSKVINAIDFGIPQKRERIYMVCFRADLKIEDFQFPPSLTRDRQVDDFLLSEEQIPEKLFIQRDDMKVTLPDVQDPNFERPIRVGTVNKGGQGERIYSTKGIAVTLSAYGGGAFAKTGGYLVRGKVRKLHPRECARLMGFPDWYRLPTSDSQSYKQFGNSVVVDVLQHIVNEIGKRLHEKSESRIN